MLREKYANHILKGSESMPTKDRQTYSLFPWDCTTVPGVENIVEHAKSVHEPTPGYRPYRTAKTAVVLGNVQG